MSARARGAVKAASTVALVAGLAAVTIAGPAAARDDGAGRGRQMLAELQKRFAAADRDGDGRLTRDEAKAGMPRVHAAFDAIDAKNTGSVGLADIVAWAREQRGVKR